MEWNQLDNPSQADGKQCAYDVLFLVLFDWSKELLSKYILPIQYLSKLQDQIIMEGILVFWKAWQKHVIKCEDIKLCKTLDLNVKAKTDKKQVLANNDS